MDNPHPHSANQPRYKQILRFDSDFFNNQNQEQFAADPSVGSTFPQHDNPNPQVSFAFTEDNIPIVDPRHLLGVATFEQLYLLSKILGEALQMPD